MLNDMIESALRSAEIEAHKLPTGEAHQLRQLVESSFAESSGRSPLWERLGNAVGKYLPDGWSLACEFLGNTEVILFFDENESTEMWRFVSGWELLQLLKECPAMEFYLTDKNASLLLCHNHHDYLIGVGTCRTWLERIADS